MNAKPFVRQLACTLFAVGLITVASGIAAASEAQEEDLRNKSVISEAQIQSPLMSFADRFDSGHRHCPL
jgi:hypothetical protein